MCWTLHLFYSTTLFWIRILHCAWHFTYFTFWVQILSTFLKLGYYILLLYLELDLYSYIIIIYIIFVVIIIIVSSCVFHDKNKFSSYAYSTNKMNQNNGQKKIPFLFQSQSNQYQISHKSQPSQKRKIFINISIFSKNGTNLYYNIPIIHKQESITLTSNYSHWFNLQIHL